MDRPCTMERLRHDSDTDTWPHKACCSGSKDAAWLADWMEVWHSMESMDSLDSMDSNPWIPWLPWLPWIPWIPRIPWTPWLHSMVSMDSHQPRPQHLAPKTLAFSLEILTSFSARNDSDTDTWPHKAFCSGSQRCWLLVAGCLMVDCCFSSPTGDRFF